MCNCLGLFPEEGSRYGIEEYLKLKNVYIYYSGKVVVESMRDDLFSGL